VTVYVDSSVVLRLVLGEASSLAASGTLDAGVTSALLEVECLRTLDRLRLMRPDQAEALGEARAALYEVVKALSVVEITRTVLERASHPLPMPLGTLDAIHLSTALLYRELEGQALAFATHDGRLGLAARSLGFEVIGA
jgi:predicted nucleic acid-binding protein